MTMGNPLDHVHPDKISGILKPNGEFVRCAYGEHEELAGEELERLGASQGSIMPGDDLLRMGYQMVSGGRVWLPWVDPTNDQIGWLLENLHEFAEDTQREMIHGVFPGLVLPDTFRPDIPRVSGGLIEPRF